MAVQCLVESRRWAPFGSFHEVMFFLVFQKYT